MPTKMTFRGMIPAIAVPFRKDHSIDEAELRRFAAWLANRKGIVALMTNGHTGEVFALTTRERAEVTRSPPMRSRTLPGDLVDRLRGHCGSRRPRAHGQGRGSAGPRHHAAASLAAVWVQARALSRLFPGDRRRREAAADRPRLSGLDARLVLVAAPRRLARLDHIQAFKIGTREMNKYARDLKAIRAVAPNKALLTCHDEYLLASMVQGIDGALVGFASLVPGLINDLFEAVQAGDLHKAMQIQARIDPLKDAVYGAGEPTGEAHGRMKAAMQAVGILREATVRPPTHAPNAEELAAITRAIEEANLASKAAANQTTSRAGRRRIEGGNAHVFRTHYCGRAAKKRGQRARVDRARRRFKDLRDGLGRRRACARWGQPRDPRRRIRMRGRPVGMRQKHAAEAPRRSRLVRRRSPGHGRRADPGPFASRRRGIPGR